MAHQILFNAGQKHESVVTSLIIIQYFDRDEAVFFFFNDLLTIDKNRLFLLDPETKDQSKIGDYSGSDRPNKFRMQWSAT